MSCNTAGGISSRSGRVAEGHVKRSQARCGRGRFGCEVDDHEEESGQWETPRSLSFLGLKGPGEGSNSLFDVVQAVLGVAQDPDANAELERLSELDRQEAEAGYEGWAARSGEREARRAAIALPGLAPAPGGSLSTAPRPAALPSLPPPSTALLHPPMPP